ncbi:hypothetical protein GH721_16700 [Kriegella sp. EG-1]|nr:hypothetical protein [Flavobacteriaceae bacterium EG-1]
MKRICIFGVVFCITSLTVFISCNEDEQAAYSSEVEYYKYNQLTNIYDNEIAPLNVSFVKETETLEILVKAFKSDVTITNLNAVQEQWKAIQKVWKQLELYDLGEVANSFVAFEINRWPTDPERIEENIASDEVLDAEFIASIGSSSKGISGLEYVLFGTDNNVDLESFTTMDNADRRLSYLVAMSENLVVKSNQLQGLWENNKDVFVGGLENGISGTQNQVINAMVTLIEEIIISKLGIPLGDNNGGVIEPDRLEAYRSETSKDIIQQHLIALKRAYEGDFTQSPFRVGFDDFLVLIGSEEFSISIHDQFVICQEKIDAINGSLVSEIETNPAAVLDLKNAFRDLLVLIKVDMANILGSTITFNDNDGD